MPCWEGIIVHFMTKTSQKMASVCVDSFLKLWDELHNIQATVVGCQHNFPISI